ncbi:MAG: hypothetical protein ABIZ71_05520 [Gemmatimonadales bacterium]
MTTETAQPAPNAATPPDWDDWVSASRTRNFLDDDPILDWLHRYGRDHGFIPDDELPGNDPRTSMREFVFEQGRRFEDALVALIKTRLETARIGDGPMDSRDPAQAQATLDAMRAGVPVIEQAVLHDHVHRTYGMADLLVRSDVLNQLVPDTLTDAEAALPAPGIGAAAHHYRVVDIKFRTLGLVKGGAAGGDLHAYMAQVWIYNEALSRLLGMTPSASYLMGRSWTQGKNRGDNCFDRLARIDHDRFVSNDGPSLRDATLEAVEWIRRVRSAGASWQVLPKPSVPELYPHARNTQDAPWHNAKAQIARELAELTLLPRMNPQKRREAHAHGIFRWDDSRVSAASLGITGTYAAQCDAVIAANRDVTTPTLLPHRITRAADWRDPLPMEFFVDFETVSNMNDDFGALPQIGGQPLIFQVGCGWMDGGEWRFQQWTTNHLTETDESTIVDDWLLFMHHALQARGLDWGQARIYHWSPAEASFLVTAYNSARERHPERNWPDLPWFDLLVEVVRVEPITVTSAFGFGLKAIAKGMHAAGLVETTWSDGPTDGLGAMIGAWWCDAEATRMGVAMPEIELMQEIGKYNEVDCRTMAQILEWLRANR